MGYGGVEWGKVLNFSIIMYEMYKNIVYYISDIILRIRSEKINFFS